jgi:hypothetical protein
MTLKNVGLILVLGFFLSLAACQEAPLPTPLPVAELPTATSTSLPPTMDLTAIVTLPAPTLSVTTLVVATPEVAVDTATPVPTATPTPSRIAINISVPDENADILMGSDIVARGLAQLGPTDTAWLSLVTLNGRVLAEAQAVVGDGSWESGFSVPQSVSGTALLQASIRDATGQILTLNEVSVHLVLDTESTDRYLALFRPVDGDPAMGGFNLFFDGRAQRPVDSTVTISIWSDNCQTQVARQSFVLSGSGYWQGFVIIPATVSGPGCAIAHSGAAGEESWREVQVPITIAANDDDSGAGVVIGNPPRDTNVTAGQELLLYGTALNASEETVQVAVLLENGRIISQSDVMADYWGYWEHLVIIPADISGPASITASTGQPGAAGYAQDQTVINIRPAPTPSP